jgi:hypothetical protein
MSATTVDIQYFAEDGTWIRPPGAVRVDYLACASGGGGSVGIGGPGRDGEAGALHSGSFEAGKIPDEVKVEIGRGGRGAAIGPVKAGDGAAGYVLFLTHLDASL